MKTYVVIFFWMLLSTSFCFSQTTLSITDQTVKLKGKRETSFFFAAATGDKIGFEVSEAKGKSIGEVQLIQYLGTVKYSNFSFKECSKEVSVLVQSIYELRIRNTALGKRICRFSVYRKPSSPETIDFNPHVKWVEKVDTVWHQKTRKVVTGYDQKLVKRTKRELIRIDTSVVELFNKTLKISARHNESQVLTLPQNVITPNSFRPTYSKEVVSWSYWIGVGQKSIEEYNQKNAALSSVVSLGGAMVGYPLLGKLAITGVSMLQTKVGEEHVKYSIGYSLNGQNYTLDDGDVTVSTRRIETKTQGSYGADFYNHNLLKSITVGFKAVAVVVDKYWGDVSYQEKVSVPLYRYEDYREPEITRMKIPVFED